MELLPTIPPICSRTSAGIEGRLCSSSQSISAFPYNSTMRPIIIAFAFTTLILAADVIQEGARWWSHVQVLADDRMEGRNTGSEGHRRAAQFVAAEFERAGLKPAGNSGYFQPVK